MVCQTLSIRFTVRVIENLLGFGLVMKVVLMLLRLDLSGITCTGEALTVTSTALMNMASTSDKIEIFILYCSLIDEMMRNT